MNLIHQARSTDNLFVAYKLVPGVVCLCEPDIQYIRSKSEQYQMTCRIEQLGQ